MRARVLGMMIATGVMATLTSSVVSLGADAKPHANDVQVVTIEGQTLQGRWSEVGTEGQLKVNVEGEGVRTFAPGELASITWLTRAITSSTSSTSSKDKLPWRVQLPDGCRFAARFFKHDKGSLTFSTEYQGQLSWPLGQLAVVQFQTLTDPTLQREFDTLCSERDPSSDTLVVVRDGTLSKLKGVTESLEADKLVFQWRKRAREFKPSDVLALAMAAGVQKKTNPPVTCHLNTDEVWCGTILPSQGPGSGPESIDLLMEDGKKVRIPIHTLNSLEFRSDRVLFLSAVEPADYTFEPFSTTIWPWRRDRSVANREMRIGDRSYARGIGMHAQSALTFELDGEFTQFATEIGIDEAVGDRGHVVFRVLADEKEVFNSGPVTGSDEPKPVQIPLAGATKLTLAVDFGENLDIGDQANWANARLIK